MPFIPKETRKKVASGYKTIYISDELRDKVQAIANEQETSFNNVVISMIEYCLKEQEDDKN